MDSVINPDSRHNPDFRWFAEARFGMFIHLSLASMFGKDLGVQRLLGLPYRQYEAKAREFNPRAFDAAEWVDVAQQGGARYVALVAKHHEGFCLWDTDTTDFKITNTPFGRDLVREVVEECRRRAVRICLYVNPNETHSRFKPNLPGNWGDRDWKRDDDEPDWPRHVAYAEAQLTELLTRYGPIDGIWFDCTHLQENHIQGRRLYAHVKRLQPRCMVNDRAKYGDFLTPEWQLTETLDAGRYLIEQCISIQERGWGWRDSRHFRSAPECIDLLVRMAGCGANLLLNVGPDPSGRIPEPEARRMRAIGAWLSRSGQAIYATEGVRLAGLHDDLRVTRRGRDVYVLLRRWPRINHVAVPGILGEPVAARILGGEEVAWRRDGDALFIDRLPAMPLDATAQVVHLRFDRDPVLVEQRPAPEVVTTVPVAPAGRTLLPVSAARCEGLAVKGWRHRAGLLRPPDAAFEQAGEDLPADSDQPYEDGPPVLSRIQAIISWRYLEQSTIWSVDCPKPLRARVRVCLRCPRIVAGSRYEIRCAGRALAGTVQGTGPLEDRVRVDWFKGFHHLPFAWEEVGVLELPAGRHEVVMQPVDIRWGSMFADVMALELAPLPGG